VAVLGCCTVGGVGEAHRLGMGSHRGVDPIGDGLTIFASAVGDEAFCVEVNLSDGDPSDSLGLGFTSPPLEIASDVIEIIK
jgi:hypothetical protein